MNKKIIFSLALLSAFSNIYAEQLIIGNNYNTNSFSDGELYINRCLFNLQIPGTGWNNSNNFDECGKLVRYNDIVNVQCIDDIHAIEPNIGSTPGLAKPSQYGWWGISKKSTKFFVDDSLDTTSIRNFNKVNWLYVNKGKKQLIDLLEYDKVSLDTIANKFNELYNANPEISYEQPPKIAIEKYDTKLIFQGFTEGGRYYDRAQIQNTYKKNPTNYTLQRNLKDKFWVGLRFNFQEKPNNYNENVDAPTIHEVFNEYNTETTGRIVVGVDKVKEYIATQSRGIIVFVTEQLNNMNKEIFNFGDHVLGNKFHMGSYGAKDTRDGHFIAYLENNKFSTKPADRVWNDYLSYVKSLGAGHYSDEIVKKYSEQLLLKNTRIGTRFEWYNKEFQDKYYGGLSKCYNFDLKRFNNSKDVKALRLGYFKYGNQILSNNDSGVYYGDFNSSGKLYYSIHRSNGNMAGIYHKDPQYDGKINYTYSINARPSRQHLGKNMAGDRNYAGMVTAQITHDFYPDIKSIKLSKDTMSINEFDNLTFQFKDINGNIITPYMPEKAEIYISQYRLNFPPSEYYNHIAYIPLIKNGNVFKINTSHENYQKLKADMLKRFKKGVTNTFTILEIKDRNTGDSKDRPIYQAGLKNYEIIEGAQAQVTFDEDDFINDLRLIQASVKNNTTIIQPGSPIENIILNEKPNNPNGVILTRTNDDYIYFVIDNPSKQTNISFSMEENGKNLTKDDFETYEINNTNKIAKYKNHKANVIRRNGDKYSVAKIYNNKTLVRLNKHNVSKNNSLKIKIYRSYDDNIKKLADNDNSVNPKDYETLLEERKVIGDFIQKTVLDEQIFSIRHKGIIFNTENLSQKVSEVKDFKFTAKSCATSSNSLTCVRESSIVNNSKLTYAGLLVKNEKSVSPEDTKIYLYLDDGINIFSNKNAKSSKPSAAMELSSGQGVLKSSLPLVTKTQILLSETYIASDDAKRGQCVEFDETNPLNLGVLNKISSDTGGKIYCQTPMCKKINNKIECDGKGFEYEFKSNGISLNLKDEKEPIKELKGLIPYAGAQKSSSGWDGAIEIDNKKPLEISLNIQDKDNYYINFAKDKNYAYGLTNLNLSFEKGTDKLQQDDKKDYFKNYVMIKGSDDIEIIESSANKSADCGYTETITNENVNVGKCINIKNDNVFKMLDELKKANESTKLSDLLNDSRFKASDTYGELKVEVAYPKVDTNGNFKTQPPFKVTLQNGYVSNEVSNTNDKYELNKASKSHLFTKTGLYFKDVSNNDGRLFYDKKTGKANNGIKFINESNKIEDLKDCGSEPCYDGKTEDLINKASDYSYDYQDSKIVVKGSDLTYEPHTDNKAEYIKDTIRYSTDKSSYLGSEKNSFTLEYKRN